MSKDSAPPFHLIIPAAGNGTRMGGGTPKQYRLLAGKPVLRHILEKFIGFPGLQSIRVMIDPAHHALYHAAVNGLSQITVLSGGKTRKESVFRAINEIPETLDEEYVLVHDAARPLISPQAIHSLLDSLKTCPAATLATPISDTIRSENGAAVDRNGLWAIQTPQGFRVGLLRMAHRRLADEDGYTDDAGMVEAVGQRVALVPGHRSNLKITTEDDMTMAQLLIEDRRETRTGSGFDVHAFAPEPAASVRLGGIDIPHDRSLAGHSDADVALHALTDAILGTIGAGDIGQIFPPSDPQWKGADSAIFLREAVRLLRQRGGTLLHCDLTILCEAPKIGPHRTAIQARAAEILAIAPGRVSVKATTTEGLGFTGRREGIAAQAVCTVSVPVED